MIIENEKQPTVEEQNSTHRPSGRPSLKGLKADPGFLKRIKYNEERYIEWLKFTKGMVPLQELLDDELLTAGFNSTFKLVGMISTDLKEYYFLVSDTGFGHLTLNANLHMDSEPKDFIKFYWRSSYVSVYSEYVNKHGDTIHLGQNEKTFYEEHIHKYLRKFIDNEAKTLINYTHQYIYDGESLKDVGNDIRFETIGSGTFVEMFAHKFNVLYEPLKYEKYFGE